jgi:hypothetical protein
VNQSPHNILRGVVVRAAARCDDSYIAGSNPAVEPGCKF